MTQPWRKLGEEEGKDHSCTESGELRGLGSRAAHRVEVSASHNGAQTGGQVMMVTVVLSGA